ncbi:cytochrome P450 705A5-like [Pistacia vera]|uniref:cytochrome P450 705A5-like n=1 Tax=Pistacia vera TaxID=55513 RepID=UPI00126327AE|nr:cytochrome P450 705A5-like [Pistacia vera]
MRKASENEVVDTESELGKLERTILFRIVTGTGISEENREAEMMKNMVEESVSPNTKFLFADALGPCRIFPSWLFEKQAKDIIKKYNKILERILEEHKERAKKDEERSENKNLMDILLEVYHDDKLEFKISRTNIKAFILDILVAGISGADEAVKWAMVELINHPDLFSKVREEIESVVGRSSLVEESDVPNLPYLQALVKKSLRMDPPAPLLIREVYGNCNIKGFDIPERTVTAINIYAIMRDPDLWEKPNEFQPERFLVSSKEQDYNQDAEKKKQLLNFLLEEEREAARVHSYY